MYKNYIFDLYGTLVDINTNEWKASLWKNMANIYAMHGAVYSPKQLKSAYSTCLQEQIEQIPKDKYSTNPEPQIEYVFQKILTEKGIDCPLSLAKEIGLVFRALYLKYIKLYDGVIDLLDTLKEKGKRIYLLSNAQSCFTVPELRALGLLDAFDGIVISSDAHIKKPSPKIMRKLLTRYDLAVGESLMLGNEQGCDVAVAHAAGMDALYLQTETSGVYDPALKAEYELLDGDFSRLPSLLGIH